MREANRMQITLRRQPRTESIILGLLLLLAMIMLAVILEFAALPALAAEPFHYPAVLRSGKKIGDLVPGLSALPFDDNDKLVIIEDAHSPLAGLGPEAVHKLYPKLKGTGHDERVIELQGQIEPCIVMMVLFSAQTRKVTKVAYAFTC